MSTEATGGFGPHAGQALRRSGAALPEADAALILLHGRGGEAANMLGLATLLALPGVAGLAPQAAGHSWYPRRFTEPVGLNEPFLSSALSVVEDLVLRLNGAGLKAERVALLGFSQGACLALEFVRRHPQRFGAVLGLSDGLIGDVFQPPAVKDEPLAGTPILLSCSQHDAHVPLARVRETELALRRLGASVTTRIRPGGVHGVHDDEIEATRALLASIAAR